MRPCQRLKRILEDYCDGELKGRDKKDVELHLGECSGCGEYVHGIQNLKSALKNLHPIHTDENFIILLRERIRREAAKSYRTKRIQEIPVWRWALAAGVAAVAVFSGYRILQKGAHPLQERTPAPGIVSRTESLESVQQNDVQYVLEDLSGSSRSSAPASREALPQVQAASSDSAARERRLDQIRDQVKIVNF
ncbi:MAG: zf-HC2 domain-containing protein [Acidobacteria bacterium]|nr:zf-HC2 domain-containing protein [Acidobacteriota bacterium]